LSVPRSRSSVSGNVAISGNCNPVERQVNDGLDRTTGDNQAFGDDSIGSAAVLEVVKQSRHSDGEAADDHGDGNHAAVCRLHRRCPVLGREAASGWAW